MKILKLLIPFLILLYLYSDYVLSMLILDFAKLQYINIKNLNDYINKSDNLTYLKYK